MYKLKEHIHLKNVCVTLLNIIIMYNSIDVKRAGGFEIPSTGSLPSLFFIVSFAPAQYITVEVGVRRVN